MTYLFHHEPTDGIYNGKKARIITPMVINCMNKYEYAALCRRIWIEENDRCFNGTLRVQPYFSIVLEGDFSGMCIGVRYKRPRFKINMEFCSTLRYLRFIIIHEMVHQEQLQHTSKYIRDEYHGRFFRRRAKEIFAITGFDVVEMYPKKGTPGFFLTKQP